jgi:hypothetical protein
MSPPLPPPELASLEKSLANAAGADEQANTRLFLAPQERLESTENDLILKGQELHRQQLNEQDIEDRKQLRAQRKSYADKLFRLIAFWLFGLFLLLAMAGWEVVRFSDSVLITYLTTTTVTVLGLFAIVAKWLFPPLQ